MFNPNAIVLWMFTTGVGFLIVGTLTGAVEGLVVGLAISLLADLLP